MEQEKILSKKTYIKYGVIFVVLLVLDQITKYLAKLKFADGDSFVIIPKALKFIYHENDGAAWGMFSGRASLLTMITVVAICIMAYVFFRLPRTKKYNFLRYILVFIAAGAAGNNLIDRILFGHVIDFIYFELIDFPVFNVADIYITCATFIFAVLLLFYYKDDDFSFLSRKKKEEVSTEKSDEVKENKANKE